MSFTPREEPTEIQPAYFDADFAEVERRVLASEGLTEDNPYFFTGPSEFFKDRPLRTEFYREFSVDDQVGIVRCQECGCVKSEDVPGAAFKYLDLLDCECPVFVDPSLD